MTNLELVRLHQFLSSQEFGQVSLSLKGHLTVERNVRAMKPLIESLGAIEKKQKEMPDKYKEFDVKQRELVSRHTDSTEEEIAKNGVARLRDPKLFSEELNPLLEEYADVLTEYKGRLQEFQDLLESEVKDFQLLKLKESDLFVDKLTSAAFKSLRPMLEVDALE
jgi:hypothetical protein